MPKVRLGEPPRVVHAMTPDGSLSLRLIRDTAPLPNVMRYVRSPPPIRSDPGRMPNSTLQGGPSIAGTPLVEISPSRTAVGSTARIRPVGPPTYSELRSGSNATDAVRDGTNHSVQPLSGGATCSCPICVPEWVSNTRTGPDGPPLSAKSEPSSFRLASPNPLNMFESASWLTFTTGSN